MNDKIRNIKKAERNIVKLSACLSKELGAITQNIMFVGFDELGLDVSVVVCSGVEILIVSKGYELQLDVALEILSRNGCIRPDDIPGLNSDLCNC